MDCIMNLINRVLTIIKCFYTLFISFVWILRSIGSILAKVRRCITQRLKLSLGTKAPLKYCKVYACVTMWHETTNEMTELLKSVMRLDFELMNQSQSTNRSQMKGFERMEDLEIHIFLDDAFNWSNEVFVIKGQKSEICSKRVNDFVKNFSSAKNEATNIIYEKSSTLISTPSKVSPTPYGGKIQWTLPGGTPLVLHLKDSLKVRRRKRWSQIMYFRYILECSNIKDYENTFILTLDGDTSFESVALSRAYEVMSDKRVGVVCGRIQPVGVGPIVWYQKFEYAISHWVTKATEDVYGSVLCSPGCFSLYRASALKVAIHAYEAEAVEAKEFLKFDLGEDRWLTSLIMRQGFLAKYSASSIVYTQAPETLEELFKQRRRWEPSTLINNVDLLFEERDIMRQYSPMFAVYLFFVVFLSFLTPSNVFLLTIQATSSVLEIPLIVSTIITLFLTATFVIVCFQGSNEYKIGFSIALSRLYGIIFTVFLMQKLYQLMENRSDYGDISFIILIITLLYVLIIGILHANEFIYVFYIIPYFALLPIMHFFCMLNAAINLCHISSWGTREDTNSDDKLKKVWEKVSNENNIDATIIDEDYWTRTEPFENVTIENLHTDEEIFWHNLIEQSLKPFSPSYNEKSKIERRMLDLRNKVLVSLSKISLVYILLRQLEVFIIIPLPKLFNASSSFHIAGVDTEYLGWRITDLVLVTIFFFITAMQLVALLVHRYRTVIRLLSEGNANDFEPVRRFTV